jgi:hypothetical protein
VNNLIKKGVAVSVILLFVSVSVIPSSGNNVIENYVSTDNQIYMPNSRNDTTPPVTNHSFNGTLGENGYYISEVEITLNATDDMSGVNATYYRMSGGWKTYTEPFMYAVVGYSTLGYYSVDNAGNIEEQKSAVLRIDLYPPSISVGGGRNGAHCGVFADTTDIGSGEDRVEFYIDDELMFIDYGIPFEWTYENPNTHTVMATVYDKAGHNASDGILIPQIFPIVARGLIYNPEFSEQEVTFFSLLVSNNYDGLRMFKRLAFPNNYFGYIGKFFIRATFGETGNRASFDDITPPVTTCTLNPPEPNGENGWYVSDVEITLNATDDMSGVNVTQFRVDGGGIYTYTEPINITTDGEHTVQYRSIDNAGNIEDWKSVEFKIDQTKPWIYLDWTSDKVDGIWYVIFTPSCGDATSGIDRVEFYKNDLLMHTDNESPYKWNYPPIHTRSYVIGLIFNPQIIEENVTFFAFIVRVYEIILDDIEDSFIDVIAYDFAGNSGRDGTHGDPTPRFEKHFFKPLTFPNQYTGRIGLFFINAEFEEGPL